MKKALRYLLPAWLSIILLIFLLLYIQKDGQQSSTGGENEVYSSIAPLIASQPFDRLDGGLAEDSGTDPEHAFSENEPLSFGESTPSASESTPVPDKADISKAKTIVLPEGFVFLEDVLGGNAGVQYDIRYTTENNFSGKIVPGYETMKPCATVEAANALQKVAEALAKKGLGIKIFDAYRPERAVKYFIEWSGQPEDGLTKEAFYPSVQKTQLFQKGYLSKRSGHSRGSTIDLTLYSLGSGEDLDMGTPYDFLDPKSHFGAKGLTEEQTANRNLIKKAMEEGGFKSISTEWWHYVLINEPFPDTYFDFITESP